MLLFWKKQPHQGQCIKYAIDQANAEECIPHGAASCRASGHTTMQEMVQSRSIVDRLDVPIGQPEPESGALAKY